MYGWLVKYITHVKYSHNNFMKLSKKKKKNDEKTFEFFILKVK
jgi:hypothetical protein